MSFDCTSAWISKVKQERGDDVVIVLVANKTDLGAARYGISGGVEVVKPVMVRVREDSTLCDSTETYRRRMERIKRKI